MRTIKRNYEIEIRPINVRIGVLERIMDFITVKGWSKVSTKQIGPFKGSFRERGYIGIDNARSLYIHIKAKAEQLFQGSLGLETVRVGFTSQEKYKI